MTSGHDLSRFVAAQEGIYPTALAELRSGRKRSHWMWFVFPQIAGLGSSAMARTYAIGSAAEAEAYLGHDVLGARLRECTDAVLTHADRPAEAILGSIDAVKLRSSMTLFDRVSPANGYRGFDACLATFFGGARDEATLHRLEGPAAG